MTILIQHLWPGLLVAGLMGFALAAIFGAGRGLPSATWAVRIGVVVLLIGAIGLSVFGLVPGKAGLWFDIGLLCVLAYAAGVVFGTGLRWLVMRPRRGPDHDAPIEDV